jgi:hypothetical protein
MLSNKNIRDQYEQVEIATRNLSMLIYFLMGLSVLFCVIFTQSKTRIIFISALLTMLTSCLDSRPPEMTTFTLTNGNREQKLHILSTYRDNKNYQKKIRGDFLLINCVYPSMKPTYRNPSKLPPGHMLLIIEIGTHSNAEIFMKEYEKAKDSRLKSAVKFIGKQSGYDVYSKGLIASGNTEITKVKSDNNGYLMSLTTIVNTPGKYEASRRIDKDIHIRYLFDKAITDDFELIDSKVFQLVNSFISH